MNYRCYASCAFGIEGILAEELRRLGLENVAAEDARVYFDADENNIARANIFLRTADRIYLVLDEFYAKTFDELFMGVNKINFADILPSDARFPIHGNTVRSQIMSVSDVQSISKKAVVKAMQRVYAMERFEEDGSVFDIYVNIHKDKVTVALNTSGNGLNRRGYRLNNVQAPLKETLAAAMILISRWRSRDFYDPMCGSGTIAIEAAMIAANMAPGLKRRFDAGSYSKEFQNAFALAREEAKEAIISPAMPIFASDIDRKSISLAKGHAQTMDVSEHISFSRKSITDFIEPQHPASIVTNPPYAMRIGDKDEVEKLYKNMGRVLLPLNDTMIFVLSGAENFENLYGKKADKKRKLYNGNLKCTYYQYFKKKR